MDFAEALDGLDQAVFSTYGQPVYLDDKKTSIMGILQDRLKEPSFGTLPSSLSEPVLTVSRSAADQIQKGMVIQTESFGQQYRFRVSDKDPLAHDSLVTIVLTPV